MTIQSNFPNLNPSLDLNFAAVEALDSRVTFTRASTATYYGTQTAKAEENLLIRSQEFDNAAGWTVSTTAITANQTTAPDGTSTADLISEVAATASHIVFTADGIFTTVSGATYVMSVFLKKGTGATAPDIIQLSTRGAGMPTVYANFDISVGGGTSGTVTASSGLVSSAITLVGNGWYRCSIVVTATSSAANAGFAIYFTNNSPSATRGQSYLGVVTADVFAWGAQLEQRSAVTAYTPTTTQPITNYIPVLQTALAGVPRFDHNPTTFESLGLLVEEQRTNLLVRSDDFANASWSKVRSSITSNTIVAPDGTLTGDKLIANTDSNSHYVVQDYANTSTTTYTFSTYAKRAEIRFLRVVGSTTGNANSQSVNFDLLNGITGSTSGSPVASSIQSVGNGWYRCSVTFTSNADANYRVALWLLNDDQGASFVGNGYSGIYIWGAQLESSSFSTSYIPTVASQVTRSADAASMTGTNFSSWYRADEGTVYVDVVSAPANNIAQVSWYVSDGTGNNAFFCRRNTSGNIATGMITNAVAQGDFTSGEVIAAGASYKTIFAYKTNDLAASTNGSAIGSDASVVLPVVNRIDLGINVSTAQNVNGAIKRFSYYPIRCTNAQLQAITG